MACPYLYYNNNQSHCPCFKEGTKAPHDIVPSDTSLKLCQKNNAGNPMKCPHYKNK